MILCEAVLFAMVKRKHTGDSLAATKRDAQGRLQCCDARGSAEMESLGGRIAIGYRLLVARHPAGKTLPQWNSEGGEEVVIHTVNIFRNQHAILANEEHDRVVRNDFLQSDRNNRKRLLQAQ